MDTEQYPHRPPPSEAWETMSEVEWAHHIDHHAPGGYTDTCAACRYESLYGTTEDTR